MGDRLGIPGAVDFFFSVFAPSYTPLPLPFTLPLSLPPACFSSSRIDSARWRRRRDEILRSFQARFLLSVTQLLQQLPARRRLSHAPSALHFALCLIKFATRRNSLSGRCLRHTQTASRLLSSPSGHRFDGTTRGAAEIYSMFRKRS